MKQIKLEETKYGKRIRVATVNKEPSLTQQAFKEDCDVNIILDRYMKTGELPKPRHGWYGDVSEIPDLTQALEIVSSAQSMFDALPAKVRYEFHNDPRRLLDFISNPKNQERAIELGILEKKVQEEPIKASTPPEGAKEGQSI